MTKRIGGFRRKTRGKFKKELFEKGKISLRNYLTNFEIDEKVHLNVEPAVQKGMYLPRYLGKTGVVTAKKGECYEVTVRDGKAYKKLVVHPVHLRKTK